eukprot:2910286-Amphidinium_carterae.1
MVAGARHPRELDTISVTFVVLQDATGMEIGVKSKILPIGWGTVEDFQLVLNREIVPGHTFADFPTVLDVRWLGLRLGRGPSFNPHEFMVQRMYHKLEAMEQSRLGSPGNIYLSNATVFSVATHTLHMCEPSDQLRKVWNRVAAVILPGPRGWICEGGVYLKELFHLPSSIPHLDATALRLQARAMG